MRRDESSYGEMNIMRVIEKNYDFAVIGGGMTGVCAAIAAARHGVKTALIQDRPVLGGNASSEVRMHIVGASQNQVKPELNEGGILHELMLENKAVNDTYCYSVWDATLFEACRREKNLTLYLNTTMHDVAHEGRRITSVTCYRMTTEQHFRITAPIFADCTGGGTLAAWAGASYRVGGEARGEYDEIDAPEESHGMTMGNTLLFKARDMGKPTRFVPPVTVMPFTEEQLKFRKHGPTIPDEVRARLSEEDLRMMFDGYCPDYGFWWIELGGDSGDIIGQYEDIRDRLVSAVYGVWDHIKNVDHSAENYALEWVGMLPGVRESRRIRGDYTLTERDVLENRRFPDKVAYGGWQMDLHTPGGLLDFDRQPSTMRAFPGSYDIPYRCYLASDFDDLYIGGRCLSATQLGMASSRVMGTCAIGGQAIGTAAAMAILGGTSIRGIDLPALHQTLLRDDCYLPGIVNEDAGDLARTAVLTASSSQPGYPVENLHRGVTRAIDGATNAWRSGPIASLPAWVEAKLAAPVPVNTVQLVFDSNFDIEKKMTMSSRRQNQQEPGVPKELVRDFRVLLLKDGNTATEKTVTGNRQRLVRVTLPDTLCDTVRVEFTATNGIPDIRVFELRIMQL